MALDGMRAYVQTSAETLAIVHANVMKNLGNLKSNIKLAVVATTIAGVLTGSGSAYAQSVPGRVEFPVSASAPNPEYDRIIVEAQKAGKDPVDYAMAKGKSEDWASKLDVYIIKRAAMKRQEGEKKIDEAAIKNKQELEGITDQIVKNYWTLLSRFELLMTEGKLTSIETAKITGIYMSNSTPPDMKKHIENKFGRYIHRDKVAQL